MNRSRCFRWLPADSRRAAGRSVPPNVESHVVRIGFTAVNFMGPFNGALRDVRFHGRALRDAEIRLIRKSSGQGP